MPRREIGLRGYLGEAIVEQWLNIKCPSCTIESQIIPKGVDKKGGPYLDFGVIKDNNVKEVYEVKTQDYILRKDFHINKSLIYIWNNKNIEFNVQANKKCFYGSDDLKAYLILLVPPNDNWLNQNQKYLKYVKLFSEIFNDPTFVLNKEKLYSQTKDDLEKNIEKLRKPENGKNFIDPFFRQRDGK